MGRPKKTDPPKYRVIENYTDGQAVIAAINSFAELHNVTPKEIFIELEQEHGYYDEVSCAIMMHAPKKTV